MLRLVASLADEVAEVARHELAVGPRVPGQPSDAEIIRSAVVGEIQVALGISEWSAAQLMDLAQRLTSVLPDTLAALEAGRLDLTRAKALAEATRLLPNDLAHQVELLLLPGAGTAPWDGPSPRAWRARIDRAVVRADADAARRRRAQAVRQRLVRSWRLDNGTAELLINAPAEDVAMAESVINDLARKWSTHGPDGERLTMDQRRVDSLMDVFRRIRDGRELPTLPVRREREIGLVLHADTLFGDPRTQSARSSSPDPEGPASHAQPSAADCPGELRGLGDSVALDPVSAAELARSELARGVALNIMLVGPDGTLQQVIRLPRPPDGGWTRAGVVGAVHAALRVPPDLSTERYAPTTAIDAHVRARQPRCVSYDCPRNSRRCDLDHDVPWPRGPTSVDNLAPRCRRNHEVKTRGLVRTRLQADGAMTATMLSGLVVTTQ
ncbi:MAG: DUF222 domain-containing protein, partial [Actinomycetes bacterium]